MIWVTSDTHFGHTNLVYGVSTWFNKSKCRHFQTVKEHDETILDAINSKVSEDDILYHLGDFALGSLNKRQAYEDYRKRIRCKNIIYIRGNHSLGAKACKSIFLEVYQRLRKTIEGKYCDLYHYPVDNWYNKNEGGYMFHGHCHSLNPFSRSGRIIDFGVDGHNQEPWNFEEIVAHMEKISYV